MPVTPTIRPATTDDNDPVATALARSFADDPLMMWLIPDGPSRERRLRGFFHAELGHAHANGVVLTTDGHAGGALWLAPKRWKIDIWGTLREAPAIVRAFGRRIPSALKLQEQMDKAHPRDEHWYLSVLGTDPAQQGNGVGGALIRGVTDRCDTTGIGAYLESSKAANVPYYERFGFVVTGEIQAQDSPILYSMWRDPQ
jgi:ribosomal protein S18 acetylase RimI-like enzyme